MLSDWVSNLKNEWRLAHMRECYCNNGYHFKSVRLRVISNKLKIMDHLTGDLKRGYCKNNRPAETYSAFHGGMVHSYYFQGLKLPTPSNATHIAIVAVRVAND